MFRKWTVWLAAVLAVLAVLGIFGYFKAVPPAGNQNQPQPKIEIMPSSFDFGEVEFGKVVEKTFIVKNVGEAILEIKRVATSCSCTTAKIAKEMFNPGEEAELQVRYDTAAMGSGSHGKGRQDRIIYVKSNDPARPQVEVTTSAFVE